MLFQFRVGDERFGIEPAHLELAMPLPPIHSMPHRGAALAGLANVRGSLTLCFALDRLLGTRPAPVTAQPLLLVLAHGGWRVACRVDAADGVAEFEPGTLLPPPATLQATSRCLVQGLFAAGDGRDVAWLNVSALFDAFEAAAG